MTEAIRRGVELGAAPTRTFADGDMGRTKGTFEDASGLGSGRTHGRHIRRFTRCSRLRCHTSGSWFGFTSGQGGAWHVTDFSKKIAHGVSVARLPAGSVQLGSRALGRFDGEEVALEWVKTVDCEEWLRL